MLHTQASDDIVLAFPTPIMVKQLPSTEAVNAGLRRVILKHAEQDASVQKSNVDGWQSSTDMFNWTEQELVPLREWVVQAITVMTRFTAKIDSVAGQLAIQAWANVSRPGAYNKPHIHAGSMWSGVYYVDAGTYPEEHPDSGTIEFMDSRWGASIIPFPGMPFRDRYTVRPASGMMLIFPSWMYHYVNAYRGEGVRISVAFNVKITSASL